MWHWVGFVCACTSWHCALLVFVLSSPPLSHNYTEQWGQNPFCASPWWNRPSAIRHQHSKTAVFVSVFTATILQSINSYRVNMLTWALLQAFSAFTEFKSWPLYSAPIVVQLHISQDSELSCETSDATSQCSVSVSSFARAVSQAHTHTHTPRRRFPVLVHLLGFDGGRRWQGTRRGGSETRGQWAARGAAWALNRGQSCPLQAQLRVIVLFSISIVAHC